MKVTAVIGHGRSPLDRSWGERIDNCDCVVRMWDCDWQDADDYGTKYDYGLFTITPKTLAAFHRFNRRIPDHWLAYLGKVVGGGNLPPCELLNTDVWLATARELGGRGLSERLTLTRGTAAAAWAISTTPGGLVILVGFDNLKAGVHLPIEEAFPDAYWQVYMDRFPEGKEKAFPTGGPRTATHDFPIESTLLGVLATTRRVKLYHAMDTWP